jgi:hypothetical protein
VQNDMTNDIRQIIAKAWTDERFKARLLADPQATLMAEGINLPPGLKLVAHEDTAKIRHFVLPAKPDGDLSDVELDAVAAGNGGRKREYGIQYYDEWHPQK